MARLIQARRWEALRRVLISTRPAARGAGQLGLRCEQAADGEPDNDRPRRQAVEQAVQVRDHQSQRQLGSAAEFGLVMRPSA